MIAVVVLMSTFAPESSTISRMTLPPDPITSRIFVRLGCCIVSFRWRRVGGTPCRAFGRRVGPFSKDIGKRPAFAWLEGLFHDCQALMPAS